MSGSTRITLSVIYWAFIVYLFVPLVLMVVMGFKDSKFIGFPINAWTMQWYLGVFEDSKVIQVFLFSMTIAVVSTFFSLLIGTWIACFVGPKSFRGKLLVFAITCLPAVIPGIISAISLRIFIQTLNIEPGMAAIILATPYITYRLSLW